MHTLILLFQCRDRKGIVAGISDFIFRHNGNIITADQHSTDPQEGYFFMRVEFFIEGGRCDIDSLRGEFSSVAREFNAEWNIYDKGVLLRMGICVSHPDHCLADILYLWKSQELRADIPFVISNYEGHREFVRQ